MISPSKSRLVKVSPGLIAVNELTLSAILTMIAEDNGLTEKIFSEEIDLAEVIASAPDYADIIIGHACVIDDMASLEPIDKARIVMVSLELTMEAMKEYADQAGKLIGAIAQAAGAYPDPTEASAIPPVIS